MKHWKVWITVLALLGYAGGTFYTGTYSIHLTGADPVRLSTTVTEPVSLILLGSVLLGLGRARRKRATSSKVQA